MRPIVPAVLAMCLLAACSREQAAVPVGGRPAAQPVAEVPEAPPPVPTPTPVWQPPAVAVTGQNRAELLRQAEQALHEGRLYEDADAAVPLYLALHAAEPDDARAEKGLDQALSALVAQGDAALAAVDGDPDALATARRIAAVLRQVAADDAAVRAFLQRMQVADRAEHENRLGEHELRAGRIGEAGRGGALSHFRKALALRKHDARALQGLAAAESALIRRAESAADDDRYDRVDHWLDAAAKVRPDATTVDDARARIAAQRSARVRGLRDAGLAALSRENGIDQAREQLARLLRIAPPGDQAAAELRDRIELAVHYGLFRPGQVFTEGLADGGRGPQMVVVPHGAFRMGASDGDTEASDAERPSRLVRFDRGFAMARNEVTVGDFRRFIRASGYRPRAVRRGYSTTYDERGGNLVKRSGVDWESDYAGQRARDDDPVVHVSALDAAAYAEWLSEQTGHEYRLPSEAEFEYALRAGKDGRYPWGDGAPPPRAGNFTGARDASPTGRHWRNAFPGYGDDAWGPAAVGRYLPNRFGLHDLAGNVSEWVADCWHDSYRRAPADGKAWTNPGCAMQVVRGGSWASSPAQTRSAWRIGSDVDTTNARVGFRVVREI